MRGLNEGFENGGLFSFVQLRRFNFDPDVDLALSQSGAWSWGSAKPQMHLFVEEYFKGRREDDR